MAKREFSELELMRREKLLKYTEMGIKPFSRNIKYTDDFFSLNDRFGKFSKDELHNMKTDDVSVFGRIMTRRGPFLVLQDAKTQMQVYIPNKELDIRTNALIDTLDIGDIIRVEGSVMKTNTGALAVRAKNLELSVKSLRPLPEKFHGLKDVEERYRRRYVDLIMSEEVKETFWTRTKIISSIRKYMDSLGYMEADTPILQSILGGAAAEPFSTHHNALDMPFYLRIATELPLKKILVGGIERVYEIGRIFRNEGIDTTHNPEFTSIEFYEAYSNLEGMMKRTEEIFNFIANALNKTKLTYGEKEISLATPFARINMVDEVSKRTKKDFRKISLEEAKQVAKAHQIKVEKYFTIGHIINELFEVLVEDSLIQPTFVWGHPIEISPLAAKNEEDGRFTDRAELFIDGREYANMFTELNDPIDQLERFESQLKEREAGNEEANEIDMDFVEALEYGMPPAGGCGIGIDRLVMLFTNKHSIREILMFPHLKNRNNNKGESNE